MLRINNLTVNVGSFRLSDISLQVHSGEYHCLLGPSGSGKTLLLETIAGFRKADSGSIILNHIDITKLAIGKRKTGLLFQDFALFPHLNVFENISYSLKIRKMERKTILEKVEEMGSLMEISHLLGRSTSSLSGGEKQRVALARLLVFEPDILLLDEPLSAVDADLFRVIRELLKALHKRGQTIIHVTHNFEEAVSLAQKISIIEKGKIQQSGTTDELLGKPGNLFVANFTGIRNIFPAQIVKTGDENIARINPELGFVINEPDISGEHRIYIQSDDIVVSNNRIDSSARNQFKGTIQGIMRTRGGYEISIDIGILIDARITIKSFELLGLKEGTPAWVSFKASAVKFL